MEDCIRPLAINTEETEKQEEHVHLGKQQQPQTKSQNNNKRNKQNSQQAPGKFVLNSYVQETRGSDVVWEYR